MGSILDGYKQSKSELYRSDRSTFLQDQRNKKIAWLFSLLSVKEQNHLIKKLKTKIGLSRISVR